MKNGQPLTIDGSLYSLSQTVTDRADSTYNNTLTLNETVPDGAAGIYTCTVSNSLGFDTETVTVGEFIDGDISFNHGVLMILRYIYLRSE